MYNSNKNNEILMVIGNWDWQPQKLKEQFGILTLSDMKFEVGREKDLLAKIGSRLSKSHSEVVNILKKLKPF